MIHLSERDYAIACSYFIESLEGFHQLKDGVKSARAFRHLLLAKILTDSLNEAQNLVEGKHGSVYSRFDETSLALLEILDAYKNKDLVKLSTTLSTKTEALRRDSVVFGQLETLSSQLLEKNILKLVKPYMRVELWYLTEKLKVSQDIVEHKLCEMILDHKLRGSIDQELGVLILLTQESQNEIFESSEEIINNMNGVVDQLFQKVKKIAA